MAVFSMRDRVARAMAAVDEEDYAEFWHEYREKADAAIAAMREPTDDMIEAGTRAVWNDSLTGQYYAPDASELSRKYCRDSAVAAWPAMVDAVIAEDEGC